MIYDNVNEHRYSLLKVWHTLRLSSTLYLFDRGLDILKIIIKTYKYKSYFMLSQPKKEEEEANMFLKTLVKHNFNLNPYFKLQK